MFKKTLIALAIAGTAFNAAATLTINAGGAGATSKGQLISAEGVANTSSVTVSAVTATVSGTVTNYASADKIRVTITGGTLTPATSLAIAYNDTDDTQAGGAGSVANLVTTGTVTYPSTTEALLALGGAGKTAVTGYVTATDTFVVSGLDITPNSKAAGAEISYKIEVLSSVGGAVIDTKTGVVATVVNQYSAKLAVATDSLGGAKIDVGDGRLTFVTDAKIDFAKVTVASAQVDHAAADADGKVLKTVLNGSFGFLDADADGDVDTGTITTTTASPVISDDFTTVTEEAAAVSTGDFDGAAADSTFETFTITVDGEEHVLVPQTFTVDVSLPYVDDNGKGGTFTESVAVGSWVLNGSSAEIPFLPFGSAYSQSVTVTNTGSVAGAVTADITFNGTTTNVDLGMNAAAKSVTDISSALRAKVASLGLTTGNARVNVVVNSPSDDIAVKAVYYSKADKDRAVMN